MPFSFKNLLRIALFPLRWLGVWVFALVILFEEWGWEPLQRMLRSIVSLLRLQRLELWMQTLPPYAALLALALPSLMLLPAKLTAFALIRQGHVIWGGIVFIAAKLVGTAVIARVFQIVQPSLMQLAWFAYTYNKWKRWKDALLEQVRSTRAWQSGKALKARITAAMRLWFKA
jgi:hypothetical protein